MSTAPSPYAYTDPRAGEILGKVIYHDEKGLAEICELLDHMTVPEMVAWLTRPSEELGWKWPLWCRAEEVKAVLAR
jgi:hypothetical protein